MAAKGGFHHRSLTEMSFGRACNLRPLHQPDKLRVGGTILAQKGVICCRFDLPVIHAFLLQWRCSSCVPHTSLSSPAVERQALKLNKLVYVWDLFHCSAPGPPRAEQLGARLLPPTCPI